MRLIGVTGRMGAGKDTCFEYIARVADEQGQRAVRRAFADQLKVSAARALGFEGTAVDCVDFCNDLKVNGAVSVSWPGEQDFPSGVDDYESWTLSGREFLQLYGTEAHRQVFDTDFWVNALLPEGPSAKTFAYPAWKANFSGADYAVVTDVRFPNEAQRVLDLGGEVWLVDADERLGVNGESHASEAAMDPAYVTVTLDGNDSAASLGEQVRKLIS